MYSDRGGAITIVSARHGEAFSPAPQAASQSPAGGAAGASYSVEVDEQNFQALLESSMNAPVVLVVYSPTQMPASAQLADDFSTLAAELQGRIAVGRVNVDAQPSIAQALQVQSLPLVAMVLQGRLQPLFQDAPPMAVTVMASAGSFAADDLVAATSQLGPGRRYTSLVPTQLRRVLDAGGEPVPAVEAFLAHLQALDRSPTTVRTYATSLKLWLQFLDRLGVAIDEATVDHVSRFVAWLRAPAENVTVPADTVPVELERQLVRQLEGPLPPGESEGGRVAVLQHIGFADDARRDEVHVAFALAGFMQGEIELERARLERRYPGRPRRPRRLA